MGYKWVHIYEKWSWIPTAITFVVSRSRLPAAVFSLDCS